MVGEPLTMSLTIWIFEKMDLVCHRNNLHTTVERLNDAALIIYKQSSGQKALQSELCPVQDSLTPFEPRFQTV